MLTSWFPIFFGEIKVPPTVIGISSPDPLGVPGHPPISGVGVSAPLPSIPIFPPVALVGVEALDPYFTAPVSIDTPLTELGLDGLIPFIKIGINAFPPVSELTVTPIDPTVFYPTQKTEIGVEALDPICKARLRETENILGSLVYGPDVFSIFGGMGNTEVASLLLGLGNRLQQVLLFPVANYGMLEVNNTLSVCQVYIQKLLNSLKVGDPVSGMELLPGTIVSHNDLLFLLNELSDSIVMVDRAVVQAQRNVLSDSSQGLEKLIGELALKDDVQAIMKMVVALTEQPAFRPVCSLEVYLNSVPIINRLTDCSISLDRGVVFDIVQLLSSDSILYSQINDMSERPNLALEIIYQGTSWSFLVEDVTGDERDFSVWGRSIAAKKSATPFKKQITFVVENDQDASDLAAELVPDLFVDWQIVDWSITKGYSVTGTPIEMLAELASSVGAIVRATPDGTGLEVVQKFPTRPVDLLFASPVVSFDRETNISLLDLSCDLGDGSNSIVVRGQSLWDQISLMFEAEESCVEIGQLAHLRVYPAMGASGYLLSSTGFDPVFERSCQEDHDEILYFVNGKASTSRPIKELISIEWDGLVPEGIYTWTMGSTDIILDSGSIGVGRVKYKSSYDRWSVGHAGAGDLLVILQQDRDSGITVRVYFGEGDREAEDITRSNLSTVEAAIVAGTAWLDDNSYSKLKCSARVPCSVVMDGQVVSLCSLPSGVEGNWLVLKHVISAVIVNNTKKIWSNLDVVQFEQP